MDFTLDSHQEAVLKAVGTLLSRHAGPARLHDLGGDEPGYDHDLDKRLAEAGFLDIAAPRSTCRLDAALVLETLSGSLASSAAGWRLLVLPTLDVDVAGPVAVVAESHSGPARFAADADALVVIGDGSRAPGATGPPNPQSPLPAGMACRRGERAAWGRRDRRGAGG